LACKVKLRDNETTDALLARFKSLVKKSNILADVRKHEFFLKKSLKRKRKSEEARKLARRKGR
jgi:small subunit ribosomal protein S21